MYQSVQLSFFTLYTFVIVRGYVEVLTWFLSLVALYQVNLANLKMFPQILVSSDHKRQFCIRSGWHAFCLSEGQS